MAYLKRSLEAVRNLIARRRMPTILKKVADGIVIDRAAERPPYKLEQFREIGGKFRASWAK